MAKHNADSGRRKPRRTGTGKPSPARSGSSKRPFKRAEDTDADRTNRSFSRPSKAGRPSNSDGRSSRGGEEPRREFRGKRDQSGSNERRSPAQSRTPNRPFKRAEDSDSGKTNRSFSREPKDKGANPGGRRFQTNKESREDFRGKRNPSDERNSFGKSKSRKEPHARFAKAAFKSSAPRRKEDGDAADKKPSRAFFNPSSGRGTRKNFKSHRPTEETSLHKDSDIIRLNKYISNSGVCSRREADEYIKMGLVSVNGNVITELGYKVNRTDEVRFEDKILKAEKPVYVLMNKPKGFITTTKDPEDRKTVMHIIGDAVKERIYPVGRLDRNTTGLLLLTNDGDLADKLMHPSHNAKKIYKVELDRPLTKADFQKIIDGVYLEEGRAIVDDLAIISEDKKTIGIEIHIGWNRVVRRIFESLLYTVEKLDRTVYAGLDKKDLPRGSWRFLTRDEIVLLKHYK